MSLLVAPVTAVAAGLSPSPCLAAPAGTAVVNTAEIGFTDNGTAGRVRSNPATTLVAELLDLDLNTAIRSIAVPADSVTAFPFSLVNRGNGREAFLLQGRLDGTSASLQGFAVDRDGDGRYDPAADLPFAPGAATPLLESGASIRLFALVRGGESGDAAALIVRATAATGSGTPGTSFDGQGDGGGDAVVGATTASAEIEVILTTAGGMDPADIALVKSQRVLAPDGSANPIAGAVITYSVEARFGDAGSARAARLLDPIPSGTLFVPGSLRLDGIALTDAADGDAGSFDGAAVRVALGDVAGPAVRILQFQVTIQ